MTKAQPAVKYGASFIFTINFFLVIHDKQKRFCSKKFMRFLIVIFFCLELQQHIDR